MDNDIDDNDLDGESLSPGPFTFTPDRVKTILQDNCFVRDPDSRGGGVPSPFLCDPFEHSLVEGSINRRYTEEEHTVQVERFCIKLYELAQDAESHLLSLDDALSTLLICNFQLKEPIPVILDRTLDLLTRLPARPLELPDVPILLHPAYLIPSASGDEDPLTVQWQTLQVAAHVSSNVIRIALYTTMESGALPMVPNFIDVVAELLEAASRLSSTAESETEPVKQQWFIVRAFLWTSWQRCTMIFFSQYLGQYLNTGFRDDGGSSLVLRGTVPCPRLSIQEMSKLYSGSKKSKYMCGWAFELLRSDPVCIVMDFRRFHQRYSEVFQNHPSRCIPGLSNASCKGDQSDSCQRFKGMVIENQSAHDLNCLGDCERLTWDEVSYRSISGARAVSIDDTTGLETKIKYCEASAKSLAISHVWSHGQGGRPEDGFNRCLHRRYISIAKVLGCTSYWMDTPCIPEDHELRQESISKINEVFMQSKVTLVCDRDLMEIDVTDLSIHIRERLLVTAIVCDWNIRAWTFLEAFRGRDSIYLLCKDNAVVSLKETVEFVHRYGSVDIGFLLLTVPHLLPSMVKSDYYDLSKTAPGSAINGYLTVENSGSLLSHRQASRPGDDIVIWSLLLHEQVFDDAELFWRSREGKTLLTSYLLSSAPRLGVRGLSWAPSSPNARLLADASGKLTSRLLSHDGRGSIAGSITEDGFEANWLLYDFVGLGMAARAIATISRLDLGSEKLCHRNIRKIRDKYLKGYRWGALLRPIKALGLREPAQNPADSSKIMVVVCATNDRVSFIRSPKDDRIFWEWKGIYEWDLTEPLPKFVVIKDVLIV
ncbi:hypothetical protein MMC29_003889 [Sticta canariensis]|nr:hypothetical protein [Sticta canariensis]